MPPDRLPARRPRASHRSTISSTSRVRRWRRAEQHPEQRRDEVDVLAGGQVRIQREQLGHVADLLARPAPEPARVLAEDADRAARRGEGAGEHPDDGRLAGARRADHAEDRPLRDREGRRRPRRRNRRTVLVTSSTATVAGGADWGSVTCGSWGVRHGGARRTGRAVPSIESGALRRCRRGPGGIPSA